MCCSVVDFYKPELVCLCAGGATYYARSSIRSMLLAKFRSNNVLHMKMSVLRAVLIGFVLAVLVTPCVAQSQVIQPCEASPSPAKAAASGPPVKVGVKATQVVVDESVAPDPTVEKLVAGYSQKVKQLTNVIGTLDGELQTGGVGASTMGHFVADGIMSAAKARLGPHVDFAFTNAPGLRKKEIQPGPLKAWDIFELLPFENSLVQVELTGSQLLMILQRLTTARDAEAGARIQFKWNEQNRAEFISAKLVDASGQEREIDHNKTYTVVTIDYLIKVAGNYAILQDGKNIKPLNITIRDAVMDYVKAETAAGRHIQARLDGRFVQIGPDPVKTETQP
ncbi:MAG: hypothetical protein C5B55_10155 [Blastocatellia bacterium]|nr:MAG: hypothetical protein C5B55_10155 [Blastocatellia bacterium]